MRTHIRRWRPHYLALTVGAVAAVLTLSNVDDGRRPQTSASLTPLNATRLSKVETPAPESVDDAAQADASPVEPTPAPEQLLLGSWQDDFYGERTFTFRDDGTATMSLKLESATARFLYGDQLEFDVAWQLVDGTIKFRMTGGRPKEKVQLIATVFGEEFEHKLLEIDDKRLLMLNGEGDKTYTLMRVADPTAQPAK